MRALVLGGIGFAGAAILGLAGPAAAQTLVGNEGGTGVATAPAPKPAPTEPAAAPTTGNMIAPAEAANASAAAGGAGQSGESADSSPVDSALAPPSAMPAIAFGNSVKGNLASGEDDSFTIDGKSGTELQALVTSDGGKLVPMLVLYKGTDVSASPLQAANDRGRASSALVRTVLPADGTYTLVVMGYARTGGPYTLRIGPARQPTPQATQQQLGFGETLGGQLGQGTKKGGVYPKMITYSLTPQAIAQIRAGDGKVTFDMTAPPDTGDPFNTPADPYLVLGFQTPLGFAPVLRNDNGGKAYNARIPVDLSPLKTGPWLAQLRVRALARHGGGSYMIAMVEGMEPLINGDNPAKSTSSMAIPVGGGQGGNNQGPLVPTELGPSPPRRAQH